MINMENEEVTSVEDINNYLRRFCLHQALSVLGIINMKFFNNDETIKPLHPRTINEWQIAYFAKALILNSNDHRRETFKDEDLFNVARIYNNCSDRMLSTPDDSSPEEKRNALNSFLIRTSYQQFTFQMPIKYLIPRTLIMFEDIPKNLTKPKFDIPLIIQELYGLKLNEFLTIGFCLFIFSKDGYLKDKEITTDIPGLKKIFTQDKIKNFINKISADYYFLREDFRRHMSDQDLDLFAFNSLKTYPIVITQIAGLVVPVPSFIIDKITTGLFYDLSDKFRSDKSNEFLEFFGKEILEKYIGMQLSQKYSDKNLLKEWDYGNRKNLKKTSDWIIIENDNAVLVECKTSGITKEVKSRADLTSLKEDLQKRIIHAVKQMHRLENDVKNKDRGLEKLLKIRKFYYLVVNFDRMFLTNAPAIREIIDKDLKQAGINDFDYQIISAGELEILMPVLEKYNFKLSDIIELKNNSQQWFDNDFDVFLHSYLKSINKDFPENELLDKRMETFLESIDPSLHLPN